MHLHTFTHLKIIYVTNQMMQEKVIKTYKEACSCYTIQLHLNNNQEFK